MESLAAYPCLCCGYRTFVTQPPGTYLVCPVCFWEDLPVHLHEPQVYAIALRHAQRTFLQIGVSDPQYRDSIRPAEPHEARADGWLPIEAQIDKLTQEISSAFANVTRDDGITIHEADVLDSYGSDEELAAARQRDTDRHWSNVPDSVIEHLSSALSFLDPKGFHYYLPAYMSWTLRHYDRSDSPSVDATLYTLALNPWDHLEASGEATNHDRFRLLTEGQAQIVCRFLRFLITYGYGRVNVTLAQKALDQYWDQFCADTAMPNGRAGDPSNRQRASS